MAPVNGIEMYYAVYGEGEPVLLIHGGLGHADVWGAQVAELMKTHKVIVADSRGHGRSTRDAQPFGYALMASDYLALLDTLGVERTALVGWSDGGIIGLDIAINHPERLSRLFAHAANASTEGWIRRWRPTRSSAPTSSAWARTTGGCRRRRTATTTSSKRSARCGRPSRPTPAAQLAAITVPTAIVLGDRDEAITRAHTDYLAETIPGAEEIILEDASHFAMLQDPEGYNRAVLEFRGE